MSFHLEPNIFVSHVNMKVTDLKKSLSFYTEVIGFKVLHQSETSAELSADGRSSLVRIFQPEGVTAKEARTTGLYHFALLLPSRSHLASCLQHLIKTGYPLQGASDHLVSEAIYLADPDGNGIEIYSDRPSEKWKWTNGFVEMDTVALDVEDLFAKGVEEWKRLPEHTIMGHIHLHVGDLRSAEEFYCDALGFDIVTRYGGQALFISTGGYHHHIGLNTWNGIGAPKPSEKSAGLQNFTLKFHNVEAREKVVENLKKNYSVEMKEDVFITQDPSGTNILLIV